MVYNPQLIMFWSLLLIMFNLNLSLQDSVAVNFSLSFRMEPLEVKVFF